MLFKELGFKNSFSVLLLFLFIPSVFATTTEINCSSDSVYNVGAGIYDITGPAAEVGMMGYAMISQKTAGINQRLWSRAFIINSPCNQKEIIFVNVDLCMVTQAVKEHVIQKLQAEYGNRFTDENVLITATHQHSGPGGYSTYALYNLTILGFDRKNFDTIVDGIINSINRAQANLKPAQIKLAVGDLEGINHNRSPQAYLLNPNSERQKYKNDTDTEMRLIRFDGSDGKPIGIINWYPIHGTSFNNKNYLISGDNKGYAEYQFEQDFHSDYGKDSFVAAFAQANAGDASPNPYGHEGGEGDEGLQMVEKAGGAQYKKAQQLYASATEVLKGEIDYRHSFIPMDQVEIEAKYTDGNPQRTCPAAIGISMLAGTQDGEGFGQQGVTCDNIQKILKNIVCEHTKNVCQGVKPIAIETGTKLPRPWTPRILPLQMFKIGNLVIVAAPFELTTMTGRRIREAVSKTFLPEKPYVVLSALANAYAGYVATYEEYQMQRYEGASTHFGPWTQAALVQEFSKLAKAIVLHQPVDIGPNPPDYLNDQIISPPKVIFDTKPPLKQFGSLHHDVKPSYHIGDKVEVEFWGSHPKNNYFTQNTFLEVEHFENGQWVVKRADNDWDTEYHWKRKWVTYSLVMISWRIPKNTEPGLYRIVLHGNNKSLSGKMHVYIGYSSPFSVSSSA